MQWTVQPHIVVCALLKVERHFSRWESRFPCIWSRSGSKRSYFSTPRTCIAYDVCGSVWDSNVDDGGSVDGGAVTGVGSKEKCRFSMMAGWNQGQKF